MDEDEANRQIGGGESVNRGYLVAITFGGKAGSWRVWEE